MDQFMRSLGEVKTYYASKLSTAVSTYAEKSPQIIFCEQSFQEGNALEFIRLIGGLLPSRDQYFVLAVESIPDGLDELASEIGADEILVKPFSTENINQIVERYLEKASGRNQDWTKSLVEARASYEAKRHEEAKEQYSNCVRLYPENAAVLIECAEFFMQGRNAKLALLLSEQVLARSPKNVRALHCAGLALKKLGRHNEALKMLEEASMASPLNSVRRTELADLHAILAETEIQSALRGDDESTFLILAKARYQLMRRDYSGVLIYLDAKRAFLSEAGKKEADVWIAAAKKLGGIA